MPHKKAVAFSPPAYGEKEKEDNEKIKRQVAFYKEVLTQKIKDPAAAKKAAEIISNWINGERAASKSKK